MREVLKALKFLHDRSIAHLDLKPQNILLAGERIEGECSQLSGQLIKDFADKPLRFPHSVFRWPQAVRLWNLARRLRGHQCARNGRHSGLCGTGGSPI